MKGIARLRAQIATDPEAQAQWEAHDRKLRPLALKCAAWMDMLFPPPHPTTARRGGGKDMLTREERDAILAALDAMRGHPLDPEDTAAFQQAVAAGDQGYFQRMESAIRYADSFIKSGSLATGNTFAKHVILARIEAAHAMTAGDPRPSWRAIRAKIIKRLGRTAYLETSPDWSRIKSAAGLKNLRR